MMKASRITNILLISIAFVIILIYGKNLIIPFVIALIFWFLTKEVRDLLQKIAFVRKHIPQVVLNLFGFLFIFFILGIVVQILAVNIRQLSELVPAYQENVSGLTQILQDIPGIDILAEVEQFLGEYDYSELLTGIINSFTFVFGKAFLIIIYALFLLLEEPFFSKKMKAMYPDDEDSQNVRGILQQIDKSIGRYFAIKTLVSIITGVLSYIALLFIGIDAPLFWAFLIFVMNFIPTVGSLIATIFPAVFVIFQFGDIGPGLWTLGIVGFIQLLVGNYIDPRLTGDSLNISPLVVILSLSFWGALWGILGMLLSVPITVMLIIIFAKIPAARPFAILLSKNGSVG